MSKKPIQRSSEQPQHRLLTSLTGTGKDSRKEDDGEGYSTSFWEEGSRSDPGVTAKASLYAHPCGVSPPVTTAALKVSELLLPSAEFKCYKCNFFPNMYKKNSNSELWGNFSYGWCQCLYAQALRLLLEKPCIFSQKPNSDALLHKTPFQLLWHQTRTSNQFVF